MAKNKRNANPVIDMEDQDINENADQPVEGSGDESHEGDTPPIELEESEQPTRRRLGSLHQPACPKCSTNEKEVLCKARSSKSLFTYYYCPNDNCNFSMKVPRPDIRQQSQKNHSGFSAR